MHFLGVRVREQVCWSDPQWYVLLMCDVEMSQHAAELLVLRASEDLPPGRMIARALKEEFESTWPGATTFKDLPMEAEVICGNSCFWRDGGSGGRVKFNVEISFQDQGYAKASDHPAVVAYKQSTEAWKEFQDGLLRRLRPQVQPRLTDLVFGRLEDGMFAVLAVRHVPYGIHNPITRWWLKEALERKRRWMACAKRNRDDVLG